MLGSLFKPRVACVILDIFQPAFDNLIEMSDAKYAKSRER